MQILFPSSSAMNCLLVELLQVSLWQQPYHALVPLYAPDMPVRPFSSLLSPKPPSLPGVGRGVCEDCGPGQLPRQGDQGAWPVGTYTEQGYLGSRLPTGLPFSSDAGQAGRGPRGGASAHQSCTQPSAQELYSKHVHGFVLSFSLLLPSMCRWTRMAEHTKTH